jgi:hypothetical protein
VSTKTFEQIVEEAVIAHRRDATKESGGVWTLDRTMAIILAAHQADLDSKVREFAKQLKTKAVDNARSHASMGFVIDADDIDEVLATLTQEAKS